MKFYIPGVEDDAAEERYAECAMLCGVAVPAVGERIESITFVHHGETWTATVGETLKGERVQTRQRNRRSAEIRTPLRDSATVLAIFSGEPYKILTDARPLTTLSSQWANPFDMGQREIRNSRRFDAS
jgi:hypothetical protein